MSVTVCLIGCGTIGEAHAQAYAQMKERVSVVAYDSDPAAAERLCKTHGLAGVRERLDQVLADRQVTAVDLCVPHDEHEPLAVASARAGKQILLEKPISRTLEEADRIIAAAREAGVLLMVAEDMRFSPAVVEAKRLIAEGAIGTLTLVQSNSWQMHVPGGWRRSLARCGGGALLDRGIHFIDIPLNLGGPVSTVFAVRPRQVVAEMEGEDSALVLLRHRGGVVSEVNVTWGTPGAPQGPWFMACGTQGTLYDQDGLWLRRASGVPQKVQAPQGGVSIHREIEHFLDCLRDGKQPRVTGQTAREALQLVLSAYRSIETGEAVRLPEVTP
jgi:predicted dehydrogenase